MLPIIEQWLFRLLMLLTVVGTIVWLVIAVMEAVQ